MSGSHGQAQVDYPFWEGKFAIEMELQVIEQERRHVVVDDVVRQQQQEAEVVVANSADYCVKAEVPDVVAVHESADAEAEAAAAKAALEITTLSPGKKED